MNASACWSIQRRSNWNVLRARCVRFWIVDRIICEKKAYRHEKQAVMERLNPRLSPSLHCHRLIEWRELSCSSLRMWFGSDEETSDSNCDQRNWGMFDRKNKRFASDCWWLYWSGFYRKLQDEESMALNSETSNWHRSQSRLNASMAKREKHHWMIMPRVDFRFRSRSLKCMIIFQSVSLDHGSIVCSVSSSFDQIETIFLRNARSICAHWFLFSEEREFNELSWMTSTNVAHLDHPRSARDLSSPTGKTGLLEYETQSLYGYRFYPTVTRIDLGHFCHEGWRWRFHHSN